MPQPIPESVIAEETAKVTAQIAATKRDERGRLIPPEEPKPKDVKSTDESIRAAGGTPPTPPEPQHIVTTIGPGEMKPGDAARVDQFLADQQHLTPAAIAHIRAGNPIPRADQEIAKNWLRDFMRDGERQAKMLKGDTDLERQYAHANAILSMPIWDGSLEEWQRLYGPKGS